MTTPDAVHQLANAIQAQATIQRALAARLDRFGLTAADDDLLAIDAFQREIAGYCQTAADLQRSLDDALAALAPDDPVVAYRPLAETLRRLPAGPERTHLLRLADELRDELARVAAARERVHDRLATLTALTHRSLQHTRTILDSQTGYDVHGDQRGPVPRRPLLDVTT